jgi:hypothetical protein
MFVSLNEMMRSRNYGSQNDTMSLDRIDRSEEEQAWKR